MKTRARAWTIWGSAAFVYAVAMLNRVALSAAALQAGDRFHISAAQLGLLPAAQFVVYFLMQVPAGMLADGWGPRRTLAAGASLIGLGAFVLAAAHQLPYALLGRLLTGLGDSLIFVNVLRLQASWFPPKRYATLSGLTGLSGSLGQMLGAAPLAALLASAGWSGSFSALGLLTLGSALLALAVVRDRPAPVSPSAPATAIEGRSPWGDVLRNPGTWTAFAAHLGLFAPFLVFSTLWGYPYLVQVYRLRPVEAGVLLSACALAYMLSGLILGWLSDHRSDRTFALYLAGALGTTGWLLMALWPGARLPEPLLVSAVAAVGAGGAGALGAIAIAKDANRPEAAGLATGVANVGGFAGGALLQLVVGFLLDTSSGPAASHLYDPRAYQHAFLVVGLCCVGALAVAMGLFRHGARVALHLTRSDARQSLDV